MNYVSFTPEGRILQSGTCQPVNLHLQGQSGAQNIETPTVISIEHHYVDNNTVVLKPPQPTPNHIFNYATKQWEPDPDLAALKATNQRAQLLQSSDWTQLPDVPLATKEAWAVYRQALRDITLQAGYPLAIDWPLAP